MTIRVLIADDQQLVRAGFRLILERQPGIEVAGEAASGAEAVMLARRFIPDVVLMDIRMPDRAACSHAVGVRCCAQIIRFWAMWIPCAIGRRGRRLLPMRPFGAALAASAAGFRADRPVR